jgi:hypothetical protein
MNIESPFLARTRLRKLRNKIKEKPSTVTDFSPYKRKETYKSNNVFKLDDNMIEAMKKTLKAKEIISKLPGINCGSCGAPSCEAFAEDIVRGMNATCRYRKEVK